MLLPIKVVLNGNDGHPTTRRLVLTQRDEAETNVARIKGLRKMYEKIEA